MTNTKYNTIIVGGGIAGLTSAAYVSRDGQKTLLIEQNNECGGLVNTFEVDGFKFEAGVRALEDAGIILPMLRDIGIELEIVKSKVSVGVENQVLNIENKNSLKDYRNLLVNFYPESENEIDNVLKVIKKVMKHMDVLYGVENPTFKDLKKDKEYLFKTLLPWLPKFIFTVGKINKMNIPVEEYLDSLIRNKSLRDIISQHFFKNTPSFFALSYFSLYLDYFYPKGGVGKLAEAVVKRIKEFGGEIKTKTKIIEIDANKNLLTDDKNNQFSFEILIWAADLKTFYQIVKTDELSSKVQAKIKTEKGKMFSSRGSDSVFSLFIQVNEPISYFKKIANGHFFYTPNKEGLGTIHTDQLNDILNNWDKVDKKTIYNWLDRYTKHNTYEISIPGIKDESLVPEGKTGIIISLLTEYDLFKAIKKDDWYDDFIISMENRIIDVITNSIYPKLKEKIIKKFSFSPLSYEKRAGNSEGSIVGWTFERPSPVINKIQKAGKSVLTPIPHIYQAGQWAYSPAGVPMSILTGKLAADKVLKK